MKKLVVIAMTLVVAGSSLAWGQDMAAKEKKGSIYGGAGMTMPMSPDGFSDNYGSGFGGEVGLGYMFTPMIEGIAWFDYSTFGADLPSGAEGGDVKVTEFMVDVKFIFNTRNTASKFKPYILVGVGNASIKIDEITSGGSPVNAESSESAIGFRGGAGAEYWASPKVAIFVDGKYTSVSTDIESTAYVPFRAGVKVPIF